MLDSDEPEQVMDDGIPADAERPCVALVPVVPNVHWSRVADARLSRADFVTQLIDQCAHLPALQVVHAMSQDFHALYVFNFVADV